MIASFGVAVAREQLRLRFICISMQKPRKLEISGAQICTLARGHRCFGECWCADIHGGEIVRALRYTPPRG